MPKKNAQPQEFPIPNEVAEADPPLPPELAKHGPLTLKEKKKHEKRRDTLMALHGTAARLSNEEQALNHARISSQVYATELQRLLDLRPLTRKKRGLNARDLKRVIIATANNLSDALREQGLLGEAYSVLALYDPKSKKLDHITDLGRAHARPDDDHCGCPPAKKSVSRVFSARRGEFVDLVKCPCGDMNATTQLPAAVAALQEARGTFKGAEKVTDAAVLNYGEKLYAKGRNG